jgi:hypothetical protein
MKKHLSEARWDAASILRSSRVCRITGSDVLDHKARSVLPVLQGSHLGCPQPGLLGKPHPIVDTKPLRPGAVHALAMCRVDYLCTAYLW